MSVIDLEMYPYYLFVKMSKVKHITINVIVYVKTH